MSTRSGRKSSSNSSKFHDGFEDLDTFWKLSLTQTKTSSSKATPTVKRSIPVPTSSKSNISTSSAVTAASNEVDFNYNDSGSITDDDFDDGASFGSSRRSDRQSMLNDTTPALSSRRGSLADNSGDISSATLNSTLPLNDSIRSSIQNGLSFRDSISSELRPSITPEIKRGRGRPPATRTSSVSAQDNMKKIDSSSRDGAQPPFGFDDDVPSSSQTMMRPSQANVTSPQVTTKSSSQSTITSSPEKISPHASSDTSSKTPKSSLKSKAIDSEKNKTYRISSESRQVSFSKKNASPEKPRSPVKSAVKSTSPAAYDDEPMDYDNNNNYDGYNNHGDNSYDNSSPDIHIPSSSSSTSSSSKNKNRSLSVTPATSRGISTPGSFDFPRGTQLDPDDEDDVYNNNDGEDTDEEEDFNDSYVVETSFNESLMKKAKPVKDDDENGKRRSHRATKGQKFEYWKNERPVYAQGDLVGLMIAMPTPAKKLSNHTKKNLKKTKLFAIDSNNNNMSTVDMKKRLRQESNDDEQSQVLKPPKLPKNVKYIDREKAEELFVWSDHTEKIERERVVAHREKLEPVDLAAGSNGKVGKAAHMFNVAGIPRISDWISGYVELPPGAIKDAEATGDFVQVFFMSDGQDKALEFGLSDPRKTDWSDEAAQRQLLSKGDSFYVPPGNIYRLENHSSVKTAVMNWVIIQPVPQPVIV